MSTTVFNADRVQKTVQIQAPDGTVRKIFVPPRAKKLVPEGYTVRQVPGITVSISK